MNRLVSMLAVAFVGLAAACAGIDVVPPRAAGQPESPALAATATAAVPGAYETAASVPAPPVVAEPPRAELKQASDAARAPLAAGRSAAKAEPQTARSAAKVVASPAAAEQPRTKTGPVAVAKAPEPALDVAGLIARLRETSGIGVFTKLALKNQVDDLLKRFRTQYQSGQKADIGSLRQPYDMLVLKVLTLLQDSDPALARTISGSREAIWGILADREKFNALA